jgi:phosphatidylinositol alpha-1,6-mannosyltransferase
MVHRLVPEAALVLAGGGSHLGELQRLAMASQPGSVIFAGEVADEDLPAYYAACDVFAMPCRSRWGGLEVEGFGIVFLEAAASGKAVVAGRSGGADEAVADEMTGLLVEGGEPKAVALAITRLLLGGPLMTRLGEQGRARVEAEFTWGRQAAKLAEILRKAAAG